MRLTNTLSRCQYTCYGHHRGAPSGEILLSTSSLAYTEATNTISHVFFFSIIWRYGQCLHDLLDLLNDFDKMENRFFAVFKVIPRLRTVFAAIVLSI